MKHLLLAASAVSLLIGGGMATSAMAQPHHDWHKGGRIEAADWNRGARVADWRGHHLHAPRRGYEWRDVDGNYVLAAIAGGAIADIIAHQ